MFKKVELVDMPVLQKYLKRADNRSCTFCVGNNYIWNVSGLLEYAIIKDALVYRMDEGKDIVYRLPELTPDFKEIVKILEEDAKVVGKEFRMSDMSHEMARCLEEEFPWEFQISYNEKDSDYVYEIEALTKLSGKKYHGKKNHINKFLKEHTFTYEPLTAEGLEECMALAETWREAKNEVVTDDVIRSMEYEKRALEFACEHYEEFGFVGGLIRMEGLVQAFTFGERGTDDTFITHFEKAADIQGLYPLINQQFTEHALQEYTYVNREEDMGLAGLRKAKQSYHPIFMVDDIWAVRIKK
ncbi:MAG: phosphatidylglycerol lysyltransferase domain-containing protein [Lachnospiraceae bacterium]|nr:phosphatidylglycerol lysyltransferase domain-containing protein [Lachnospiraceae bacterium]